MNKIIIFLAFFLHRHDIDQILDQYHQVNDQIDLWLIPQNHAYYHLICMELGHYLLENDTYLDGI